MKDELYKCKNDLAYFISKYCYAKDYKGNYYKFSYFVLKTKIKRELKSIAKLVNKKHKRVRIR